MNGVRKVTGTASCTALPWARGSRWYLNSKPSLSVYSAAVATKRLTAGPARLGGIASEIKCSMISLHHRSACCSRRMSSLWGTSWAAYLDQTSLARAAESFTWARCGCLFDRRALAATMLRVDGLASPLINLADAHRPWLSWSHSPQVTQVATREFRDRRSDCTSGRLSPALLCVT